MEAAESCEWCGKQCINLHGCNPSLWLTGMISALQVEDSPRKVQSVRLSKGGTTARDGHAGRGGGTRIAQHDDSHCARWQTAASHHNQVMEAINNIFSNINAAEMEAISTFRHDYGYHLQ